MPGLNPADYKISSGELNRPVTFYFVNPETDSAGGVLDPASTAINPVLAWTDFAGNNPYQGQEIRDAQAKLGEEWSRFVIRYKKNRMPTEGMRLVDKWSGYQFEIIGVQPIGWMRQRVELTCRRLQGQ